MLRSCELGSVRTDRATRGGDLDIPGERRGMQRLRSSALHTGLSPCHFLTLIVLIKPQDGALFNESPLGTWD